MNNKEFLNQKMSEVSVEELTKAINIKLKDKEEKIYVPKEIGIFGGNDNNTSGVLLNPLGQNLYKIIVNKSFNANCGYSSDNTGNNYYLKEVDKPEANKLYFVTDRDNFESLNVLYRYCIYLTKETYCYWNKFLVNSDNYYEVHLESNTWKHYYEIIKEEQI